MATKMFKVYLVVCFPLTIVLVGLIWLYKLTLSKIIGRSCKFLPTCSTYALWCVWEFGAIIGGFYAIKRILRCRANNPAGVDFPKLNLYGNYKFKC